MPTRRDTTIANTGGLVCLVTGATSGIEATDASAAVLGPGRNAEEIIASGIVTLRIQVE